MQSVLTVCIQRSCCTRVTVLPNLIKLSNKIFNSKRIVRIKITDLLNRKKSRFHERTLAKLSQKQTLKQNEKRGNKHVARDVYYQSRNLEGTRAKKRGTARHPKSLSVRTTAEGCWKLKTNNGARVSRPSEQSVAIELGSVFVHRDARRWGCRGKGIESETERENVATLGLLRVEGLRSVLEGLRWSVWRGGGTKRAVEYISRRVSRSSSLCPPLSITLRVISNAEGAKSLEIGARPSRKTTCPDRVCWNPPFTSMSRRILRFDFEDVTGRCDVCDSSELRGNYKAR